MARHVSGTGDPDDPVEQRFGRIDNPTVHIGLNQLRRLVNAVIDDHGAPAEIVVELARELKQGRKENEQPGHGVNLTENRDGRQGAAGGIASPAQEAA